MAEDNRLSQIKEGAGLEESRLNVELIEFLRKWSTPVLLVLAAVAIGYFLWNKQKEARQARIDEAFAQYNSSTETGTPSPDALRRIAQDYQGVTGVSVLAQLAAADQYLRAVQRGVMPGALLNQLGEAENAEDVLGEEDRERFLAEAETLYKDVHARTVEKPQYALHTLSALYGLAAVAESRGDLDAAKNVLDQAHQLAIRHGFAEHAVITEQRIETLPSRAQPVSLIHKEALPPIPALEPEPAATPEPLAPGPAGPPEPAAGGTDPGPEAAGDGASGGDAEGGDSGAGDGAGQGGGDGETDADGGR